MERDKQKDLAKLADAFFDFVEYDGSCGFGSVGTDCKRPFGNSYVVENILEILGYEKEFAEEQKEYASNLYQQELAPYLREQWRKLHAKTNINAPERLEPDKKVGSVVRLKSGGPAMVVEYEKIEFNKFCCVWVGDDGKVNRSEFYSESLEIN